MHRNCQLAFDRRVSAAGGDIDVESEARVELDLRWSTAEYWADVRHVWWVKVLDSEFTDSDLFYYNPRINIDIDALTSGTWSRLPLVHEDSIRQGEYS